MAEEERLRRELEELRLREQVSQEHTVNVTTYEKIEKPSPVIIKEPEVVLEREEAFEKDDPDQEIRERVRDDMVRMKSNLVAMQNDFLKKINDLRVEAHQTSLNRFDALEEVSKLKQEIMQKRQEVEDKKKMLYNSLLDRYDDILPSFENTKMPPLDENFNFKLPRRNAEIAEYYYMQEMTNPNGIVVIPDLDDHNEVELETSRKYIDINNEVKDVQE